MPVRFGKYVLHERVGQGGMAEVFRATSEGPDGATSEVAIKRILVQYDQDPDFIDMFIDEARIAVALSHPNVAQVFEFDQVDGLHYLAMEYVDGKDLRTVLAEADRQGRPLRAGLALHIGMEVCKGLRAAHLATDSSGLPLHVVHRDISPHNIRISYTGEVKILDFGVAKARDKLVQTQAGTIRGKLQYMAPEQVRAKELDHRADLFSLGLTLYKALTGFHPFEAESEVQVLERLARCEIEPPSHVTPGLPGGVDEALMRALAVVPDDRYSSAQEMHDALAALLRQVAPATGRTALADYMHRLFEIGSTAAPTQEDLPATQAIRIEPTPPEPASPPVLAADPRPADWSGPLIDDSDLRAAEPARSGPLRPPEAATPPLEKEEPPPPAPTPSRRGLLVAAGAALGLLAVGLVVLAVLPSRRRPPPTTPPSAPPPPAPGHLSVRSEPPGADVLLDDRLLEKEEGRPQVTPVEIPDVPAGRHDLRLQIPGYRPWEGQVEVTPGGRASVGATLSLTHGRLQVGSTPPGAEVLLDGTPVGRTPLDLKDIDRATEHALRLSLPGHRPHEETLVFEGESLEVHASLPAARDRPAPERRPSSGYLSLNAIPWARIFIDGRDTGKTTPAQRLGVSAGRHSVRLYAPSIDASRTRAVTVRAGQEVRLSVDFRKEP